MQRTFSIVHRYPRFPLNTTGRLIYFFSARTFSSSFATASPTSEVEDVPPISFVRTPASIVRLTASSTALASAGKQSEYCSNIAIERIAATGLTIPCPEMSGAEPIPRVRYQSRM
jgi:hypothetical protein